MSDTLFASPPDTFGSVRGVDSPQAAEVAEGAFGRRMAANLRPDADHPIEVQMLRKSEFFVTRLRCETGLPEISTPFPSERAFIVSLQLRQLPFHAVWLDGALTPAGAYPKRAVSIVDLEQRPTVLLPTPFDILQFHVSRAQLAHFASDNGCPGVETLSWPSGAIDAVADNLGRAFLPALARPQETSTLFLDHAALALMSHFVCAYGGMHAPQSIRGGLAPWQERRSKALMSSRMEGDISLGELADECRLSRSYFARAFKKSTGESPHRWLLGRRVETAKHMLLHSDAPLAEVAVAVGFSDQSHLTKVFSRFAGATPGAWRRDLKRQFATGLSGSGTPKNLARREGLPTPVPA